MKKVLIIANSSMGLYKFRKELIKELVSKTYKVEFTTPSIEKEFTKKLVELGANYHEISYSRRGTNIFEELNIFFKYLKLIKSTKPDMVITYTMKCNIYGSLASRILDIPYINTITGLGKPFERENFLKKILSYMMKIAMKKSKAVFFQNISDMENVLNKKIIKKNQCVLVNGSGVNLEEFKPLSKTIIDKKIRFLFIGRMVKHKGIEELLDVAENLKKKYTNIIFQFLGPYDGSEYKKRIEKLNLEGIVEYLGPTDDVQPYIRNCDCIVLPSYTEGMSNVLLESGAMGKSLIASDIPGCREIIEDGKNGYLVHPKDTEDLKKKIEIFINLDFSIREKMGCSSTKLIEHKFDRKIVMKNYILKINEKCMKRSKKILETV